MKKNILGAVIAFSLGAITLAPLADDTDIVAAADSKVCLLTGMPPPEVTFNKIKDLRIVKHGYGSVNDVIPLLVTQARELSANAIIAYNGAQRFGFWPWQFVRPTASGIAVTWELPEGMTCEAIGGTYKTRLNGPLTTDA